MPKARSVSELLATLPAQLPAVFWTASFDKGLDGLFGFASIVSEPNDWAVLDKYAATTGVDLRTGRGWESLGVDTTEGMAVLVSGLAAPTLVVKTRDPVRLDKFINLWADTSPETDGHAIGDAHGTTVHSYRGTHWAHVGSYTWLTWGRDGRLGMSRMLQHMRHENAAVKPDHPLGTDANFLLDMNQVRPTTWLGWHGANAMQGAGSGGWACGIDIGKSGFETQIFTRGEARAAPAGNTPIEPLVQRYNAHDLIFSAFEYVDMEDSLSAALTPPAPPSAPRRNGGRPGPVPTADTNQTSAELAQIDAAFTKYTGLHWRQDIASDVRGVTFGLGLGASDAPEVQLTLSLDVADPNKAATWLATTAQTLADHNVVLKRSVETNGSTILTVYRIDTSLAPLLVAQGGVTAGLAQSNAALAQALQFKASMALVGNTLLFTLGSSTFDDAVRTLVDPTTAHAPWLLHKTWAARGSKAQSYAVVRLGRIGDIAAGALGGLEVAAGGQAPPAFEGAIHAAHAWQRMGDVISTTTLMPEGRLSEVSCDFTSVAEDPNHAGKANSGKHVELPALAMVALDADRVWFHGPSGRSASAVSGVRHNQKVYLSQTDAVRTCRRTCWEDPHCLGFFEQTKQCPEPRRNDHKGDPTRNRNRGCIRLCGYFNDGQNPTRGNLTSGPTGSVWVKSDAFGKGVTPEKWFGRKPTQTAGP